MSTKTVTIQPADMIRNLDGGVMQMDEKDLSVKRAIALILVTKPSQTDPLRAYLLGKRFVENTDQPIELDGSEVDFIEKSVRGFEGFNALVLGQILEKLQ